MENRLFEEGDPMVVLLFAQDEHGAPGIGRAV
jgi:hypothetical protein